MNKKRKSFPRFKIYFKIENFLERNKYLSLKKKRTSLTLISLLDSRGFSAASFRRHSFAKSIKAFAGLGILRLTPSIVASASPPPSMHNNVGMPALLRLGDRFTCCRCCCCGKILVASRLPCDFFGSSGMRFSPSFSLSSSYSSRKEWIEELTSRRLISPLTFFLSKYSLETDGLVSAADTTTMIFPRSRMHRFSSQISLTSSVCA